MKLLFDQNMSPKLPARLVDLSSGAAHVRQFHSESAPDTYLWEHAKDNNFAIATKDVDFSERPLLYGFPPKVVWFKRGNCSASEMEIILRKHADGIKKFFADDSSGLFVIQ